MFISLFFFSSGIVALGQPARIGWLGAVAAVCGFVLFFCSLPSSFSGKQRFWAGTLWFTIVQFIQLSWMTSIEFQGYYILIIYALLAFGIGCQFGLLTRLLPEEKISFSKILFFAALWTLMEWLRLFFLCGFSWNPVGLALSHFIPSMQLASVFGVFGLSFWVIMTNLLGVNAWRTRFKGAQVVHWLVFACIPYFFGAAHLFYHRRQSEFGAKTIDLALVQTALLPSEKSPQAKRIADFIPPFEQWRRILESLNLEAAVRDGKVMQDFDSESFPTGGSHSQLVQGPPVGNDSGSKSCITLPSPTTVSRLKTAKNSQWDFIVLPEAVVPLQSDTTLYSFDVARALLFSVFGAEVEEKFPPLTLPYAELRELQGKKFWFISNLFWCQTLANWYHAEVVAGLDHTDQKTAKNYNSAFYFKPHTPTFERYDKQILLPLAEYLPFDFLRPLSRKYGIYAFFSKGEGAKIFGENTPFSPSICYEETFPNVMRQGRLKGAELFINVTNDNYFPDSSLHRQHLFHARLRAVENGIPHVRASNAGGTAAIDSFGQEQASFEPKESTLGFQLIAYHYRTLFSFWGEAGIVGICLIIIFNRWCHYLKSP